MVYGLMSCSGFDKSFLGGCTVAWLAFAILVFLVLILRRQLTDHTNFDFNLVGGMVGAILPYLIIITLTGSTRFAFLGGLAGLFIGGYFGGLLFGGGSDSGGYSDD